MKKRIYLSAGILLLSAAVLFLAYSFSNKSRIAVQSKPSNAGFAVVELFTSEGCSSCPPADAAVARLLAQKNHQVYILSFHVDYWNRLGWNDAFSQAAFSARQTRYAHHFSLNGAYTPQVVVNGTSEFVGSDEKKLHTAVETDLGTGAASELQLEAKRAGETVNVTYKTTATPVLLQLALVQPEATTEVQKGENHGRTLHHVNIVRYLQTADVSGNGSLTLTIPADLANQPLELIAFTQSKETYKILGAAQQRL